MDQKVLQSANDRLTHRGPDDSGYYIDGNVGIAMRRLSIIDVAGGHQPISNETEQIHIVYNGELYNYQHLRETLQQKGHRFKTKTDTESILHNYKETFYKKCTEEFTEKWINKIMELRRWIKSQL